MDPQELEEILTRDRPFVWIKRHLTPEQAEAYRAWEAQRGSEPGFPGSPEARSGREAIYLLPEARRYYPHLTLAGPILGFCNLDQQGLEGLEYQFDRYLYGKPKNCRRLLDARGQIMATNEKAWLPETMGDTLVLTLDATLQYIAEKELAQACQQWKAAGGLVIIVRPQTGEILAMAQYPPMDPNRYQSYPLELRQNRHITHALEPGSTFKIFIAAAALDAGVARPGDRFHCEGGAWRLGAKEVIHDAHPYGTLTLAQIIQKSSNIGAAKIGQKCGGPRLYDYLRAFGFGRRSLIAFPGENAGLLKDLRVVKSLLDRSTLAFGQGISVTPLQLTMALAALGNRGVLMYPLLVKEIVSAQGRLVTRFTPRKARQVVSPQTAQVMLEIMQLVTQQGGTGTKAAPEGFTSAGKTGTAQKLVGRSYSHSRFNALFIGLVPAEEPALAITVIIEEPKGAYYGGVVAAPVFRRIAEQSLRVLGYYPQTPGGGEAPVLARMVPGGAAPKGAKPQKQPPAPAEKAPKSSPSTQDTDRRLAPQTASQKAKPPAEAKTASEPSPGTCPSLQEGGASPGLQVMPDVQGLTMREVLTLLHQAGLRCQMEGTGKAVGQNPSPGTPVAPGSTCKIKFGSSS